MTQEEKQLLLQDLSARLTYGVIVSPIDCGKAKLIGLKNGYPILFDLVLQKEYDKPWEIEYIKPYLRPLSSMTEEECDKVEEILGDKCVFDFMGNGDIVLKQGRFSQNKLAELYDYYNSIHVDYRGMIPMGLSIEVTADNNPYTN